MQKKIKPLLTVLLILLLSNSKSFSQVKLEDIPFNLEEIFGKAKILTVKKGFNPVFKLGEYQVNTVGLLGEKLKGVEILGQIFSKKNVEQINKLQKTYKTGLIVYKVLSAAGSVLTVVSTVKGFTDDNKFNDETVKTMLYSSLTSIATGVITKLLTKKASYKAVDIFNGVVQKTIKDIFSVAPASSNIGLGIYVKL